MDRCKNCAHWDKDHLAIKINRSGAWFMAMDGREGACLRTTEDGHESGSLAIAIALKEWKSDAIGAVVDLQVPEARDRFLLTSPYFGCVMHETRIAS